MTDNRRTRKSYIKVNLSPADKATIQAAADEARMSDSQFLLLAGLEIIKLREFDSPLRDMVRRDTDGSRTKEADNG